MTEPDSAGIFVFSGIRYTNRLGFMVSENTICEVREMCMGVKFERVVLFMGRATPYRLELFKGKWKRVSLETLWAGV